VLLGTDLVGDDVPGLQGADRSYSAHPAAKGDWTYQVRGNYTATAPGNVWTGARYQGTVAC